jgi:RIO-like serine/threonine protein kinase
MYLFKLDPAPKTSVPVEVLVLRRLGPDNEKFLHPYATTFDHGAHVILFEWKENLICNAKGNVDEARRIGKYVLEALVNMHDKGLCHGDVKFDNVVDTGERAYLVDFNLAYEPKVRCFNLFTDRQLIISVLSTKIMWNAGISLSGSCKATVFLR